jgi:hypothetical protein
MEPRPESSHINSVHSEGLAVSRPTGNCEFAAPCISTDTLPQ